MYIVTHAPCQFDMIVAVSEAITDIALLHLMVEV